MRTAHPVAWADISLAYNVSQFSELCRFEGVVCLRVVRLPSLAMVRKEAKDVQREVFERIAMVGFGKRRGGRYASGGRCLALFWRGLQGAR